MANRKSGDEDVEQAGEESVTQSNEDSHSRPRRKRESRKRLHEEQPELLDNESDASSDECERPQKVMRRTLSHINVCGPAFPRSIYEGWEPPLTPNMEAEALAELKTVFEDQYAYATEPPIFTYFKLDDFSIYRPNHPRHAHELVTLDRLQNRGGFDEFLFDGTLSIGDQRRFVQGVRFRTMAIDGYGDADVVTLHGRICIQSPQAERNDVWYQLGKPSEEYKRFYWPFLWLAQFTKYFVDYLLETYDVTLGHFRSSFFNWLQIRFGKSTSFSKWHSECRNRRDFRTDIAARVGFLWKECYSIDDAQSGLYKHALWGEVDPMRLNAIPPHETRERRTIVTPFTYKCFKRMYFAEYLEERNVSCEAVLDKIAARKKELKLTPFNASQPQDAAVHTPRSIPDTTPDSTPDVGVGDVICVESHSGGPWKTTSPIWFAYVQEVRDIRDGRVLDVIWLYEPRDTTLGTAHYPFQNELFLSDNCSCGKDAVHINCVIGKADVAWFVKDPSEQTGLYVRQKFRTVHEEDTYDFVSLQNSDFRCACARKNPIFEECRCKYGIGDCVLVKMWNKQLRKIILEPAHLVDFQLDKQQIILRRLRRKTDVDRKAPRNQLLLTEELFSLPASRVVRKCRVRSFSAQTCEDGVPMPYDRNGAGDFYFVVEQNDTGGHALQAEDRGDAAAEHSDISTELPPIEEGLDPSQPCPFTKLRGMGLFCGGGNFDRGLEEGGGVEFRYAVDWAERAIHSYRANLDDPSNVHFFCGSVNDYIAMAMADSSVESIACPGDVHFIDAGSPCPGFSTMQPNKQSSDSLRNASMVASVVSYVDFYSPQYCILENVVSMTHGMGANKDENVFAQLLAAFVALGYQAQQFHMGAWNYGSPESRPRLFIVASAPGLDPFMDPPHTHGNPINMRMPKTSLGKSSNGLPFGVRRDDSTPFEHLSPAEATEDLPYIGDAQPQLCPAFPDHRTPSELSIDSRERIAAVPIFPYGMGLVQAFHKGRLKGELLEYFHRLKDFRKKYDSKSYSRVYPNGLFPTVTTMQHIACGIVGRTLHWSQHRPLTVMELRRAQGFLDHEVVIGSPAQQVEIIGNSVERNVAFALGLSLRESWANSTSRHTYIQPPVDSGPQALDDCGRGSHQPTDQSDIEQLTLSQEEKQNIIENPTHGFQIISQILRARANSFAYINEEVLDASGPEHAASSQEQMHQGEGEGREDRQLPTRPHPDSLSTGAGLSKVVGRREYKGMVERRAFVLTH